MKKLILGITTFAALAFSMASSAFTLGQFAGNGDTHIDATDPSYVDLADWTTPSSTPMWELNSNISSSFDYDYVIGIFNFSDGTELDVLSGNTLGGGLTSENVIFNTATGEASTTVGGNTETIDSNVADGITFGFFIRVTNSLGTVEEYYSDDPEDIFYMYYDPLGLQVSNWATEFALGIGDPVNPFSWNALIAVSDVTPHVVPLPAAAWLFGSALLGLLGIGRRRQTAAGASA